MSKKGLARNISVMSIAVFLSRILGLVRDQVMAFFFGGNYLNDAFNVAYNIPNLLRRLFGEGALSTAFVPIYNDVGIKEGKEKQIDFALNTLSLLTLFLIILTFLGMLFAPQIVKLLYPGLAPETSAIAIRLTRIIFPYLFLIGMSSTFIAILNSHEYFFMTGLSSALLNIGMILNLVIPYWIWKLPAEELILWAAWGVIVGGILQTAINLPYLKKVGYVWKIYISFGGEALSNLWKRFVPSMIGIGIREINLVADALMASFLPIGSITALGYGNRLMQLPLGIFAISASTAVLPMYSRCVSQKNYEELAQGMRFTALSLSYIMLPVTTTILLLAPEMVSLLFGRGAFDAQAALMTSQALVYYSLGLLFYGLNQSLTPLFYAHGDTKTPVKLAAGMVALNISLNFILMQFIQHRGLALSTSLTALVNYLILIVLIRRKMPHIMFGGIASNIIKSISICLILFGAIKPLSGFFPAHKLWYISLKILVISIIVFIFFYLLGLVMRLAYLKEHSTDLWKRFLKR